MRRPFLVALLFAALAPVAPAGAAAPARAVQTVEWCGTEAVARDREPDALPAMSIHVVYAYPQGALDRLAQLASPIATDLNAVSSWWRGQDSTRVPRFDLYAFPGCPAGLGQLDLSDVQLPHDASAYAGPDRYRRIRDDLNETFADQNKKTLVFYDGAVDETTVCGESPSTIPGGGAYAYAVFYLGSFCGDAVGGGNRAAVVIGHELLHALGALPTPGPPHPCPGDPSHPCDSRNDILYPTVEYGGQLATAQLDVGRDDYYGHSGAWPDIQDSAFLERLDSPDRLPPTAPRRLTATGSRGLVVVSWLGSRDDVGPVRYEIFRDGVYLGLQSVTTFDDVAPFGETHLYTVQAVDAVGRLAPAVGVRFRAGFGIVDASGRLVRDTVAPTAVTRVRSERTAAAVVLRWSPASDRGGLLGYEVRHDGRRVALVRGTRFAISPRSASGRWTVRAVDRAGNRGDSGGVTLP